MSDVPTPRILLPSVLAGPIVLLLLSLAYYVTNIPRPVELGGSAAVALFLLLPVSIIVGIGPAIVCNGIGTLVMIKICDWFPLLRFPFIWAVVGGLAVWGAINRLGLPPEWQFAFIGAGAISALLCRIRLA